MASILNATTTSGLVTSADNSGSLQLQTNNGTTAVTIDTSQNVGIGTASPSQPNGSGLVIYDATLPRVTLRNSTTGTASTDGGGLLMSGNNLFVTNRENGNLIFEAANAAESMRIDSSGNVGIGTSSPVFASGGGLSVYNATAARIKLGDSTSGIGSLDGVELIYDDDAYLWNRENTALIFGTNNTERMRVTSGGAVCVGTTSAVNNGTFNVSANNTIVALKITGSEGVMVDFRDNSNDQCGYIYSVASSNTTTYATSSDYRLKENIAPMTGALDKVAQLKPVTYTWTKSGIASQGFIAHELQAVVPECVVGEKDAVDEEGKPFYQGVDTSFLVATLTAAIQELKAELDTVKAELNTLKNPPVEGVA